MIKCEGETKIQKKFDVDRKTLKAGLRKLRSLVKVKIRLAKEHGTVEVDQPPLPIVKSWYGEVLETVDDAENFFERNSDACIRSSSRKYLEWCSALST
ncbi:hypothetical protein [Methanopyrus sp.]